MDEAQGVLRKRHVAARRQSRPSCSPCLTDVLSGRSREKDGFTYPVAIYDHRDGQAVSGGFAYYGTDSRP